MPTPGFPAGTLDEEGFPVWITGIAADDQPGTVHVVRGLAPIDALQVVGARQRLIRPCRLPDSKPDEWTSLPRAAIGVGVAEGGVLLAGQVGAWAFIYDDGCMSAFTEGGDGKVVSPANPLSAGGREAATSNFNSEGDRELFYAADGAELFGTTSNVDPAEGDIPAGLRAAVEAAGKFEARGNDLDDGLNMRVICALADLSITLENLRAIPLLAAEFG
jgi:hypothetical protein